MYYQSSLHIRLFILVKRMRIILDVLELKKNQYKNQMADITDVSDGIITLLETIQNYSYTEELCDEMLDYCYNGVMCTEKIMNLLDLIYDNRNNNFNKNNQEVIELLQKCNLKYKK